jgi:hypothetical protein
MRDAALRALVSRQAVLAINCSPRWMKNVAPTVR